MGPTDAWRRVYITTGRATLATALATEAVRDKAEEYLQLAQEADDDWRGCFERNLPGLRSHEPDRPVVLRATSGDGFVVGHHSYEGFEPARLVTDFDHDTAQFGSMVMYYALDGHADLSPEAVASAVHADDESAWWRELEAYRDGWGKD